MLLTVFRNMNARLNLLKAKLIGIKIRLLPSEKKNIIFITDISRLTMFV